MFLGVDLGTSKVAAVVVDVQRRVLAAVAHPHNGEQPAPSGFSEQDPGQLLAAADAVITQLPAELRRQCRAVGVTGQMHGAVVLDAAGRPLTPLVTWQDQRGLANGFADGLSQITGYPMRTGFGCTTLAWYITHHKLPKEAACSATIHDLFVTRLCEQTQPLTDPTDAASWGLFDLARLAWDQSALAKADIPAALLPTVQPCGSQAGQLGRKYAERLGLPSGLPVMVAIGDNPASLTGTLTEPEKELALTLGTGGQLSAVLPAGTTVDLHLPATTYEYRPFPGQRWALVAAIMCGGSAWIWLFETAQSWLRDLGLPPFPENALYQKLNELGLAATDNGMIVRPSFLGERHAPELRGQIDGLDLTNFSLGSLARGLAAGIVQNLRDMLPARAFTGRTRIVGSGNALRKNPLLAKMTEQVFGLPLVLSEGREEAAAGAAILAARLAG